MAQNDRKAVMVTGSAGGIGRAASERLAKNGWNVLAVDRDAEKLNWAKGFDHIVSLAADVSSAKDNARMVATAEKEFGGLNAVILNAAITGGGTIDEHSFEDFTKVIAVNLYGPVLGIKAALPLLRKNKDSSILITSSTMGLAGDAGNWAYVSSKHAVVGLVKSLSRELGCEGIRVNAICPGTTRATGMTGILPPEVTDGLALNVPLMRWADADEMASVMEFLISPGASYVSGIAMAVDGGAMVGTGLTPPARAR